MKLFLLSLLPIAGIACSSMSGTEDAASSQARRPGTRKVAAATAGHGTMVASAASTTAANMTAEQIAETSVFGVEDSSSPTLKGKHRQIAASTSSHGTQVANAASAAAVKVGEAHEAEATGNKKP